MPSTLITNISELLTLDEQDDSRIKDAAIVFDGAKIAWIGSAKSAPAADHLVDAGGRAALPGWVDSHTHMIFAGDRSAEFEARMAGDSYKAGGINVTVDATRQASDEALERNLLRLIREAWASGTTTLETKTGYGLTVKDELRSVSIARKHVESLTFLGAHLVPRGSGPEEYLSSVINDMLPQVASHVDSVDVFCETGAFDEEQSLRVLEAAKAHGLATRVHGNQLGYGPGVKLAVENGSLSVDHVAFLTEQDIEMLAASWANGKRGTVATVLPACDLSTKMPLAPARKLIDSGAEIAIATNCNPGSSYTTSMPFNVATAVLQMNLSVEEAIRAATLGGAKSLGLNDVGALKIDFKANLQLIDAPSVAHLAYRPGVQLVHRVWKNGEELVF